MPFMLAVLSFTLTKLEQMITHRHVLLRQEGLIGGITVTIILCLHACLFCFGYFEYFLIKYRCFENVNNSVKNFIV